MAKRFSLDSTQVAYTIFGKGIKRGNPKKCLRCGKRIQRADTWETNWSAQDSKLGRYATIKHFGKCPKSRK